MKRIVASFPVVLVALLLLVAPASAGWQWCYKDPVVTLNGTAVQILVAVPDPLVPAVNGPIDVVVGVPEGVSQDVTFLDAGFNGYGETVTFVETAGAVAADGSFVVSLDASLSVDPQVLAEMGLPAGEIPVEMTVITNGELTWEAGLPVVVNGETIIVEGSSVSTTLDLTVQGSN